MLNSFKNFKTVKNFEKEILIKGHGGEHKLGIWHLTHPITTAEILTKAAEDVDYQIWVRRWFESLSAGEYQVSLFLVESPQEFKIFSQIIGIVYNSYYFTDTEMNLWMRPITSTPGFKYPALFKMDCNFLSSQYNFPVFSYIPIEDIFILAEKLKSIFTEKYLTHDNEIIREITKKNKSQAGVAELVDAPDYFYP